MEAANGGTSVEGHHEEKRARECYIEYLTQRGRWQSLGVYVLAMNLRRQHSLLNHPHT